MWDKIAIWPFRRSPNDSRHRKRFAQLLMEIERETDPDAKISKCGELALCVMLIKPRSPKERGDLSRLPYELQCYERIVFVLEALYRAEVCRKFGNEAEELEWLKNAVLLVREEKVREEHFVSAIRFSDYYRCTPSMHYITSRCLELDWDSGLKGKQFFGVNGR